MQGNVVEAWRHPVKSMMGERLDAVTVSTNGVLGDRGWAARDEVRGGIRGAKKIGALMKLAARYETDPTAAQPVPHASVTLPDGTTVSTRDPDVHAKVSAALDHPITLFPLQPPDALEHYRRGAPDSDDLMEELRSIFGREPDEPLPDFMAFPPEILEYESPPGTYFDVYPLLVMTRQTLAALGEPDVRRFRPNLVLDVPGAPGEYPELAWAGRTIAVGDVELKIEMACPRCVMITRPFADLDEDRALLRKVVRDADQNAGVYATVVRGGTVRVGDEVQVSS